MKVWVERLLTNWIWDDTGLLLLYCGLIAVVIILLIFIFSDKSPKCYYLTTVSSATSPIYKINADMNWYEDQVVFYSMELDKTLKVYNMMKQCAGRDNNGL